MYKNFVEKLQSCIQKHKSQNITKLANIKVFKFSRT